MLVLVTGGSGSGKSACAENLAVSLGDPRIYLATMQSFDTESDRRILRHRNLRKGKGFETLECCRDIQKLQLTGQPVVLLECMSNLVANEMFGGEADSAEANRADEDGAEEDQTEEPQTEAAETRLVRKILSGIKALYAQCSHLVIVTNEIFSDGIEYDPSTKTYQRVLARINREIASMADQTLEVVCGEMVCSKLVCSEMVCSEAACGESLPGNAVCGKTVPDEETHVETNVRQKKNKIQTKKEAGGLKLYIGGFSQGKLAYVKAHEQIHSTSTPEQWHIVDGDLDFQKLCGKPEEKEAGQATPQQKIDVLNHAHLLIRHLLENGQDADAFLASLWQQNPDLIMICDEVGLGVVPVDKAERLWREKVGRICCEAAKQAQTVVRITCGLGQVLKEEQPVNQNQVQKEEHPVNQGQVLKGE